METTVFKIESTEQERSPSPEVSEFEPATMEKIVIKEFILKYEAMPELWDNFSLHYQNGIRREIALTKLLKIYKKIKSDATVDDVKKKINSIRSNFRREWNKIEASKHSRGRNAAVYKPRSWAFHLLTFLKRKGQPLGRRTSTASEDSEEQHRERLGTFTSLQPPPKRWKHQMTEQENTTCSSFSPHSVNAPLDQTHSFSPHSVNSPSEQPHSLVAQSLNSPIDQSHSFLSQSVNALSTVHTLTPTALYWSHKLDNLNRTQRLYAEKFINEILLEAELGNLGRNSVLINSCDQVETPKPSQVYSVCHPTPSSSDK